MSGEATAEARSRRLADGITEAANGYRTKFGLADECMLEVLIPDFALGLIADAGAWATSHGLELVPILGLPDDSETVQVIVFRRGTWGAEEL